MIIELYHLKCLENENKILQKHDYSNNPFEGLILNSNRLQRLLLGVFLDFLWWESYRSTPLPDSDRNLLNIFYCSESSLFSSQILSIFCMKNDLKGQWDFFQNQYFVPCSSKNKFGQCQPVQIVVSSQSIDKFKIDVITSSESFEMSFLPWFQGNLRYVPSWPTSQQNSFHFQEPNLFLVQLYL